MSAEHAYGYNYQETIFVLWRCIMSRYSVVARGTCEKADMQALNVNEKCIYYTALTLRRQNITGLIYITVRELAKITGVDENQAEEALFGENLREKIEYFTESGILWLKDFIIQQFAGKISPKQKKGILNRLMEYPDYIIRKFLEFNRKKLNLRQEELDEYDFAGVIPDEICVSGRENISLKEVEEREFQGDKYKLAGDWGSEIISDEDIYFTHSNTLSDTRNREPEQEPGTVNRKKEPEPDPQQEHTLPPCFEKTFDTFEDSTAAVLLNNSVSGKDAPQPDEPSPTTEMSQKQIHNMLVDMGINRKKASQLVKRFDGNRIFRQVVWHPLRGMKSVGALVRSIEDDWEKPYGREEGEQRREASQCARKNPGCISGIEKPCRFCPNKAT